MVLARAAELLLCALCALVRAEDRAPAGCSAVRQVYSDMGFSSGTVPENVTAGKKHTHTRITGCTWHQQRVNKSCPTASMHNDTFYFSLQRVLTVS